MAAAKKQTSIIAPDTYYELNQPASHEESQKRLDAFWEDFYELRCKHKLPDIYAIFRVPIAGEGDCFISHQIGNPLFAEPMTAWAFGREQSDRQARIMKLTDQGAFKRLSAP